MAHKRSISIHNIDLVNIVSLLHYLVSGFKDQLFIDWSIEYFYLKLVLSVEISSTNTSGQFIGDRSTPTSLYVYTVG